MYSYIYICKHLTLIYAAKLNKLFLLYKKIYIKTPNIHVFTTKRLFYDAYKWQRS